MNRARQAEGQRSFRGNINILLPCESRACGSGAASRQATDQRAFAATSDSADNRAQARTPADESGAALAFALFHPLESIGANLVCPAVHAYRVKT